MRGTNFEKFISVGYAATAVLQVVATWRGIAQGGDLPNMVTLTAAGIVGAVPILGSATGMWGAMEAWGWPFLPAMLVFFWYVPAVPIAALHSQRPPSGQETA